MSIPSRLFVTGASGFIGTAVVDHALKHDYNIFALSRSEASDEKLRKLNVTPVRGDLSSLDILKEQSSKADLVIHLATAFLLNSGGNYEDVAHIDVAAVDAIAEGMRGSNKALVVTSGTLAVSPDPEGHETTESSPQPDDGAVTARNKTEAHSLAFSAEGIRVMGIRLAPYTYGRGGSNIARYLGMAAKFKSVLCVDGGKNYTSTVHVDDAAELFLLAARKGRAGEVYNATASTNVKASDMFDAIASLMQVPVRDITLAEAKSQVGDTFAWFLQAENRASSAKARRELGWEPKERGILDDISNGSYSAVAKQILNST